MKKKILFIIWSYTYGGGAEALLTMIANHLNPDKYDVSIIEYHHVEIKTEPVNENIKVLPYIEAVKTPENHSKTYQLYHTPEVLIDTYINRGYDLYVSFNYLIPTFLLPKGTKNIAWIHGDVYDLAEKKMLRERTRQDIAFDKVQKIVAISDRTEQSIKELFPKHADKVIKIYNGVDIDRVQKMAQEKTELYLEEPSILFVGRLDENKNPVRLVQVLKLLHQQGIYVHLYFMGKGEEEKRIIDNAQAQEIMDYVHLLGYQQNPFPIIKQCNVVCLLSQAEGFSVCLLEAVALDKPFVATKIGGSIELSNSQRCGRVIDTNQEAVEAIKELLEIENDKIRAECRESIKRFELKQYIRQIELLFDKVLEG